MTLVEANEKQMPGSLAARGHGCECRPLENRHGMGWPDMPYQIKPTCPLHGVAAAKEKADGLRQELPEP